MALAAPQPALERRSSTACQPGGGMQTSAARAPVQVRVYLLRMVHLLGLQCCRADEHGEMGCSIRMCSVKLQMLSMPHSSTRLSYKCT